MHCAYCKAEIEAGSVYCPECGKLLDTLLEFEEAKKDDWTNEIPACDVCGKQDESLRFAQIPYVISFVIMTHRSEFAGVWCQKHRNLRLYAAGLITSTVGWLGIPFGIIFTPIVLFQLAKGGIQHDELNFKLLKNLADHKSSQGDALGARKCLEASLAFQNDDQIRQQVQYQSLSSGPLQEPTPFFKGLWKLVLLLIGAAAIGTLVGVIDYTSTNLFARLFPNNVPIYIIILMWVPLVASAFVGGLVLFQMIEKAIQGVALRSNLRAILGSGLAGLLAVYTILQGAAVSDFLAYLIFGGTFASNVEVISSGMLVALAGGVFWGMDVLQGTTIASTIYIVFIFIFCLYYVGMGIHTAVRTTNWQRRLLGTSG